MIPSFIDTLELTYRSDFDTIRGKTKIFTMYRDEKNKGLYKCTEMSGMGFYITSNKCSPGERHEKGKGYKIVLRVNPNKFYAPYLNSVHIYELHDFGEMLVRLNKMIGFWFNDISLDDFELTRIDIAEDIHGVPEIVIKEYIQIMRQLEMYDGFELNRSLEKNTKDFKPENSFNAIKKNNNTTRLEFTVYNKHHETQSKSKYSKEEKEYYKNTMRIELRCMRWFINKNSKGLSTSDAMFSIFARRNEYIVNTFYRLFLYYSETCFLPKYWQNEIINKRINSKKAKKEKMQWLVKRLSYKSRPTLKEAMNDMDRGIDAKARLLGYFEDIGFAPVPISNSSIPFLLSLSSMFGFGPITDDESYYYEYIKEKSRGKEEFWNEYQL